MSVALVKRSGETRTYTMNLSLLPEIVAGDTVASVSSVTATAQKAGAAALTVSNEAVGADDQSVTFDLAGGTDGASYRVTVTVVTAAGHTLEGVGYLLVSDT